VSELALNFDYNATDLQWELLAPGLINWVTNDTHLGIDRNYVEMDIDDTFTPDNAWSSAVHDNDYSDADSQRMDAADVISSANWSDPTQEKDTAARPAGEPTTPFRLDQLFNFGGSIEYQNGELDLPGEVASCTSAGDAAGTCGADPLLAQFQGTDPNTGKAYADDFGWLSHTYDTPYLDVGCATEDYIEAELNENTSDVTAAAGATAGTGGLGLAEQTLGAGASDVADPYGTYNPQVFVPGNHSGFADLDPGTPATVDPPDLDEADASTTGGTLAAGTYEYAVTDQFNAADSVATDQSQAYVTDGEQGDLAPVVVTGSTGSTSLVWQAICHAANYIVYRAPVTGGVVGAWSQIGTLATPDSATLPDNSSGDTSPAQSATVCSGPTYDPTSCGGEQELTFTDTGQAGTAEPAGWTPPVVENANELPWEQNPYFSSALTAVGITTVGADASKAYPDPANDQFGIGATYSGPTYAAGQPFVDGTAQVAPRHPINIFYNAATNAQELDEYNTLYTSVAPDSQCQSTSVTTCSSTLFTFPEVISQVVSGMFQNMLSNSPETSYVHQTNLMGTPPYSSALPPANYVPAATSQPGTDGDGLLYEVLNPLISEYDGYFNSNTPYEQLTLGGIGATLAEQDAWAPIQAASSPTVTASEQNGVVTVGNTGSAVSVPVTVPPGTTVNGSPFGQAYGGELSSWVNLGSGGTETLTENVPPAITSAASATSIVGTAFSFTVDTTGAPTPAITESGALPAGITLTDNGNGTATLAGTSTAGSGGSYPIVLTAANATGSTSEDFTLTNAQAPSITSPSTATFTTGVAGTYTVTTTGYPAPAVTESGTLPSGLSFTGSGSGPATISGTAASGATGSYPVTLSATNSSGSQATLSLTITVSAAAAPTITSGSTAFFTLNAAGAAAVTTTGSPVPAISETGALPAGLSFTDNGNGTALLSGTGTATGTTSLNITASNGVSPAATQAFSVVVGDAPSFTSADSATATAGSAFSFTVQAGGYPAPSWGESNLPPGVTFTDNKNGTATLSGTPTTPGTYAMPLAATNAYGSVQQTLTITVQQAPAITSGNSATFTVGTQGSFAVMTTGSPTAAITESGTLPSGVTFTDNGNGTATLAGTAAAGTAGSYPFTINAANGVSPAASQSFTLTVDPAPVAPVITSAGSATFAAGQAGTFTVTTTGTPAPALSATSSPALPSGVTFTGNGNGTATLAGTPPPGSQGTYLLTINAGNSAGTASQSFTLTVSSGLAITSAAAGTATAGQAFSFTVTTTGSPAPTLTRAGTLPSGITFTGNSNGTATLAGTPAAGDSGSYPLTFTAKNSSGTTSQAFTLTVDQVPSFSSAAAVTETAGTAFAFAVTTKGYPAPKLSSGSLPAGVSFADNGNGSGTLSGTTAVNAGTYTVTVTAANAGGTASQGITLTVKAAGTKEPVPTFTSTAAATATAGQAFTFTVTTAGSPTTYATSVTHAGILPAGVSFSNDGNGTATLTGTPTAASGGSYPVTFTASNSGGTTTQMFVLTVSAAPAFTTVASATATDGSGFARVVKTTGAPTATLAESGALPRGLTWTDNGNGTASLAGTPGVDQGGVYDLTFTASNTAGTTTQSFTLTVDQAPAITSAAAATATHGKAFTFTFTAVGYPVPSVTHTGTVRGLTYSGNGNGTATLSGTPATAGNYSLTITTKNSVGTATQAFTLAVS
jgi:hypothetical protein